MTLRASDVDVEGLADTVSRADGCGRPDSPLWMAEWCYYQAVLDTGHYAGPLERAELSGRIETDPRLRGIRAQVDAFASKLAARLHPGAWSLRNGHGAKKSATYHCADCGDSVSRRKNTRTAADGAIRCGRCTHYRRRFGRPRPGMTESNRVRASA